MVIFVRCEMEDDGRRSSKKSGIFKWVTSRSRPSPPGPSRRRTSARGFILPTERRPLRSVPLVAPFYRVEPEVLINEFVEKETKYLGTVTDLESHFDATDRSSLLKIVDEQQTLDLLPCQLSYENDIIISFSVHNIKLLRRDGEKMIQRIQTHKIAAVGYVRDDNQHLVFIKFASELNPKMCNLSILCCTTKTAAEEVCSLAQQVFQLVYTDSTIDFLNKAIMYGAITPKNDSYSTDDSDKKDTVTVTSRDFQRNSLKKCEESLILPTTSQNVNSFPAVDKRFSTGQMSDIPAGSSATLPLLRQSRSHRRSGSSGSSSNNNIPPSASASTLSRISPAISGQTAPVRGELQLHDYMTVLKEQLTNVELQEFAKLLKQFRTGGILIHEFSSQLLNLYTDERRHLLLGMRHFIPNESDLSFFNKFLKNNNVKEISAGTISSWWAQAPRINSRTLSETEESNTSVIVGNITASSSGSERASASVVSNDDSGEWKDLFGNIEKFGIYPSTDSGSGGAELENSHKTVNGTPPNTLVMDLDSPILIEDKIQKSYAPLVAEIPEAFQDDKEDTLILTHQETLQKKALGTGVKISLEGGVEKTQSPTRKSKSDTSTVQISSDSPRPGAFSPSMTSSDKGHRRFDSSPVSMVMTEKSQTSKPQKEHRKKKKHKKEVVAMF